MEGEEGDQARIHRRRRRKKARDLDYQPYILLVLTCV